MMHKMKLNPEPFDLVRSGGKTLEIRLNDTKRQQISVGDTIEFIKRPDLIEKVDVEVLELLPYRSFSEIVEKNNMSDFGYPNDSDKDDFVKAMYDIYDKSDEEKWGVLGIRIKKRLI